MNRTRNVIYMIHTQIGIQLVFSVGPILQDPKDDKIMNKMLPGIFIALCPDLNAECFLLKRYRKL